MKKRLRYILLVCAALLLAADGCLMLLRDSSFAPEKQLTAATEAHFIDVGQGDATLLLSGGQAVLIDAGVPDAGDTVVEYLQRLGVKELYAAVATHPHADHIGGMADVIHEFPIEHFYCGPETTNTAAYSRMLDALEERDIALTVPCDGETLPFDSGAELVFLGPADDVPSDDLNNRSLIALFRAGGQTLLLMGDAEASAEASLIAHHPTLSCDILKAGHHGSQSSSSMEFLRTVQPSTVVISCGLDNEYGHPHKEALSRLADAGVQDIRITMNAGDIVIPFTHQSSTQEEEAA